MSTSTPIPEDDLHAYIDGQLPPERRQAVAEALAADPALAARAAAFEADILRMRALFGPVAERPLPAAWLDRIAAHTQARPRLGAWRMALAACLVLGVLAGSAALLRPRGDTILQEAAAAYDGALAPGTEISARAIPSALGLPVHAPDLRRFGYQLAGIKLFRGPAAGLTYRNAQNVALTIYVRKSAGEPRFDLLRRGKLRVCIWQDDVVSAVMTGDMPAGEMMRIASTAYTALDM
jgi:anti-sigma factor RsiW